MTDLITLPSQRVQDIQRLLRESYGSGFTIFKELVQNAEDARATRLIMAASAGFPGAHNPLLRTPGLFIANDGAVSQNNWRALQFASGGGKAGEAGTVGRFGLGQKALYHLCDAFALLAWPDGAAATTMVLNPFEGVEQASAAATDWRDPLRAEDAALLTGWAQDNRFGPRHGGGLVLYIPLRTPTLRPGPGSAAGTTLSLTDRNWTPDEALDDILNGQQLAAALCCLRSLAQIEIRTLAGAARRFVFSADAQRLRGPGQVGDAPFAAAIAGRIRHEQGHGAVATRPVGELHFTGHQVCVPAGRAAALLQQQGWPEVFDMEGRSIPPKATPHGAAIVCRSPGGRDPGSRDRASRPGEGARLRLWQAVYLPLGDPASHKAGSDRLLLIDAPLPEGSDRFDIVLHGDFFVTSDRATLRAEPGNIESDWNAALLDEATLPSLLDALHAALQDLPADKYRYGLVRALAASDWWQAHALKVCGQRALTHTRRGAASSWALVPSSATLRPLPEGDDTRPARLKAAWPDFERWCESQGFVLGYGTMLGAQPARWHDAELATIIQGIGTGAFTDSKIAATLAEILKVAAPGPLARAALAESWRTCMRTQARLAPVLNQKQLVPFLPPEHLLVLPRAVDHREVMAALATVAPTVCVKEELLTDLPESLRKVGRDEAVNLLAALAPLLANDTRSAEQALTTIAAIMRNGPTLQDLARDPVGRTLAVFPVVRVADGTAERITPLQVQSLVDRKILFQPGFPSLIRVLAEAIAEPAIYQVRQNFPLNLPLPSANSGDDKLAVVMQVKAFGPAAACAGLIRDRDLAGKLQVALLRKLVARDPALTTATTLAQLDNLPEVLEPLAAALLDTRSDMRLIAREIAEALDGRMQNAIGLERFDLGWLADQLAKRQQALPPLDEAQAVALLTAGLDHAVLGPLPLHRALGDNARLHAAGALVLGQIADVPERLRPHVRVVDLWPDNAAQAVQRKLVEAWGPGRLIDTVLASPAPAAFMDDVLTALTGGVDLRGSAAAQARHAALLTTAWLDVEGTVLAPGQLLDLPADAIAALRLLAGDAVRISLADLPEPLRRVLRQHDLAPEAAQSFRLAFTAARRAGVAGLALDTAASLDDLRTLARGKHSLAASVWPLLASALRASDDDALIGTLVADLPAAADQGAIVAQMNALAAIAATDRRTGEAARRLHDAMFVAHRDRALAGFLPPALQMRSEAGAFAPASELALDALGVLPAAQIARNYGLKAPEDTQGAAQGDTAAPSGGRMRLSDAMRQVLSPFRLFAELNPCVIMVLAMVGGTPALREIAEDYPDTRSFEGIRGELDDCARRCDAPCGTISHRLDDIRFVPDLATAGKVQVRSAAGTWLLAPVAEGTAILNACTLGPREVVAGRGVHLYHMALTPVKPRNVTHAQELLRAFIDQLAGPLMMGNPQERRELCQLFDSYLKTDQASLDETCAEVRDHLPDRLGGLKGNQVLRPALEQFHDDVRTIGRDPAKAQLWDAMATPAAAAALLEAMRRKIRDKGYDPSRALFELFQNAVDAARQAEASTDLRIELQRDGDGTITNLRIVHWGRPINQPGPDAEAARQQDHRRDLANMLAMDHSAKDGGLHGRHGLGFKTVHMLSDGAQIACGRLALTIRGGLVPQDWPEGRQVALPYNRGTNWATVINLPIPQDRRDDAETAWHAFSRAAPLLPAMAPEIGAITLCDGALPEVRLAAEVHEMGEGIGWVGFGADQDRRALRLDLGDGFRFHVQLANGMPVAFAPQVHRFWNLVPLDGEAPPCKWVVQGPFSIDQGRRGLSGTAEEKQAQFRKLGHALGQRLVSLYRQWPAFAASCGIDPASVELFFDKLVGLLADDLTHDGPQRALHDGTRGLGLLLAQCPLVPLAFGGRACAGEVRSKLSGSLTDADTLARARGWLEALPLQGKVVEPAWAVRLEALRASPLQKLDLALVARHVFGGDGADVTPERARQLGSIFNSAYHQKLDRDEQRQWTDILKGVRLRARDGRYHPASQLAFAQDLRQDQAGDSERARAAFAPAEALLCTEYRQDAIDFAQLARSVAGYNEQIVLGWLRTADADAERAFAALLYLVNEPGRIAARLKFMPWLPMGHSLERYAPFRRLTPQQQGTLQLYLPGSRSDDDFAPPPAPVDARAVLAAIADWWARNRVNLIARHDRAVYPDTDLFDIHRLRDDDNVGWFTMLALATFQTLGRIRPESSRGFLIDAMRDGWWHDLADIDPQDEALQPFVERLLAWSEPDTDEAFMMWKRCLVDLCKIARHLDDYRTLFRHFAPRVAQTAGPVSLRNFLQPRFSQAAAQLSVDAPDLARSLGLGGNWLVRELARNGIYGPAEAQAALPYGWSTTARVRNLITRLGLPAVDHGVDEGWTLYRRVAECMGDDAPFGIDGDLPLQIITDKDHVATLELILTNNGAVPARSPETAGFMLNGADHA